MNKLKSPKEAGPSNNTLDWKSNTIHNRPFTGEIPNNLQEYDKVLEEVGFTIGERLEFLGHIESSLQTLELATRVLRDHVSTGMPTRVSDARSMCLLSVFRVLKAALGNRLLTCAAEYFEDQAYVKIALSPNRSEEIRQTCSGE